VSDLVQLWTWDQKTKRDVYPILDSEKNKPIPISEIRDWLFATENQVRIQNHLSRYFSAEYTGKHFEWFAAHSQAMNFTPWDILAVESLSVTVPVRTARLLLEPNMVRDDYLAETHRSLVPGRDSLWTCDEDLLGEDEALSKLYKLLRDMDGLGYVTTSKLLAAKFPSVIPIRDSKVETLLGLAKSREWWAPIRNLFTAPGLSLADHIDGLNVSEKIGNVTTLRRLDVVLWMEAKARGLDTLR
jgi:hypothetical protein